MKRNVPSLCHDHYGPKRNEMLVFHGRYHCASTTGGTLYLPSRMDLSGRQTRSQRMKLPEERGQPNDSWPTGAVFWMQLLNRTVGIRHESGVVADAISIDRIWHKVISAHHPSSATRMHYSAETDLAEMQMMVPGSPESLLPAPSTFVVQYIASSGTFIGPGNSTAHAAQENAAAALAAAVHGRPAVDLRDIGAR